MSDDTLFAKAAKAVISASAPWDTAAWVAAGLKVESTPTIIQVCGERAETGSRSQCHLGTCYGLAPGLVVFEPAIRRVDDSRNIYCGLLDRAPRSPHLYTLRSFSPPPPGRFDLSRTARRKDPRAVALRKAGYAYQISFWDGETPKDTFGLSEATWAALERHIFPLIAERSPLDPIP